MRRFEAARAREGCPHWCVEDHERQVLPDDRRHQSATTLVPAIVRRRNQVPEDGGVDSLVEPEEPGIIVHRALDDAETWLSIAGEYQALAVSVESAHRLQSALSSVLAECRD